MASVYLSLGSNIDDRSLYLNKAISAIRSDIGQVIRGSGLYETEAWGYKSPKLFLNMALLVDTSLDPEQLLGTIKHIEKSMGRKNSSTGYSDREIDIDIIFYSDLQIESDTLTIPHPRMHKRRFVLEPLNEIAPDFVHPVLEKSVREMLASLSSLAGGEGG